MCFQTTHVAPRAGAWIETLDAWHLAQYFTVAPRAGAWIETMALRTILATLLVAPRAGAWIETSKESQFFSAHQSPPVRGRGLKLPNRRGHEAGRRRPPCGGVD